MIDIDSYLKSMSSLVNGKWVDTDACFPVLDKYSETTIAQVGRPHRESIDQALRGLLGAVESGAIPPLDRARILHNAADILGSLKDKIVPIMVSEAGFTAIDVDTEVERTVSVLHLCAEEAIRIVGEAVNFSEMPSQEQRLGLTIRAPLGIVCAITPFNSPLYTVAQKIAPAIAAGNAVILKPSELTPISAAILCIVLLEAGLPENMLALVNGSGQEVADLLIGRPEISFYSFTGSTRAGEAIHKRAGLRRSQMELGSISSTILCADGCLDLALPKIVNAAYRKAGQVCMSVQRLYVQEEVVPDVTRKLHTLVEALKFGDPAKEGTQVGPLISRSSAMRIEAWIEDARRAGAEVLSGGNRIETVIAPTLLTNLSSEMKLVNEEVFGPCLSIIPFSHLEEAVQGANNTRFGLSVGIFTNDVNKGLYALKNLRFGCVHLNETSSARADAMPFVGVKDSGFGPEGPRYAIKQLTEERLLTFNPY